MDIPMYISLRKSPSKHHPYGCNIVKVASACAASVSKPKIYIYLFSS